MMRTIESVISHIREKREELVRKQSFTSKLSEAPRYTLGNLIENQILLLDELLDDLKKELPEASYPSVTNPSSDWDTLLTFHTDLEIKNFIRTTMLDMGMRTNLSGFDMCFEAIILILKDRNYLRATTSILYPELGEKFKVPPKRIERNIRTVIDKMFSTQNAASTDNIYRVIGNAIDPEKVRCTNSEFLSAFSTYIYLNLQG